MDTATTHAGRETRTTEALSPEVRSLYPFADHYHETPEGRLHYVDEGKGHPVLMVHGNPTWSFMWRHLIQDLRHNHRCIAVDHLGCGLSDKPQEALYTLRGHIERLRSLVDALELEEFDLVVHDWGGAIGMGLATLMPERVRRIIITNTAAFIAGTTPLRIRVCRWPLIGPLAVRGLNLFARCATNMTTRHPLPEPVKQGLIFPYDNWDHRVAIQRFVDDIPRETNHPTRADVNCIAEELRLLRDKPIMICWGLRDWCFTPVFLTEWTERFPQARVKRYPEAAHLVLEDAPEARQEIVQFLA